MDGRPVRVKESTVRCGESRNLLGVLTEPTAAPAQETAVLLLNAGVIYRIGPNRSYVDLARRLAGEGLTSCRFDISGIGDSSLGVADSSVLDVGVRDTRAVMDHIERSKGIHRYVLAGVCSGADIALEAARADRRVAGVILINGSLLPEDVMHGLYAAAQRQTTMRYYRKNLFNPGSWWRLLTGKSRALGNLPKLLTPSAKRSGVAKDKAEDPVVLSGWQEVIQRGVAILLIYSEGSTALDLFTLCLDRHLRQWIDAGRIDLQLASDTDHVFTPLAAQQELIDHIAHWLRRHGDAGPAQAV
jgi:pimeloyl-ACP methyl ester carboxylesterase